MLWKIYYSQFRSKDHILFAILPICSLQLCRNFGTANMILYSDGLIVHYAVLHFVLCVCVFMNLFLPYCILLFSFAVYNCHCCCS